MKINDDERNILNSVRKLSFNAKLSKKYNELYQDNKDIYSMDTEIQHQDETLPFHTIDGEIIVTYNQLKDHLESVDQTPKGLLLPILEKLYSYNLLKSSGAAVKITTKGLEAIKVEN